MGPNEPLSISFDLIIKSTHLLRGENTKKNILSLKPVKLGSDFLTNAVGAK